MAALSEATAESLITLGYTPDFIGKGNLNDIASQFKRVLGKAVVFFPLSSQSVQSIVQQIPSSQCVSGKVYETICLYPKLTPFHAVFFTSPSNVKSYIKHNQLPDTVFAIGETTASFLNELGVKAILPKSYDARSWIGCMEEALAY